MKTEIYIAYSFVNWIDLSNDKLIGSAENLIQYVNKNRLKVMNKKCFLFSNKLWDATTSEEG